MLRKCSFVSVLVIAALVPALALAAADKKKRAKAPKTHVTVTRHWNGYGFLPGYAPAEAARGRRGHRPRDYRPRDYYYHGPYQEYVFMGPYVYPGRVVYPGGAGFYRNGWNGGSFGPCYTSTPIGMMWNCGR